MVGLSKIDAQGEKTVSKSAYRQPITPQGLKAIEAGTLTWLDDEMYNNLNTGVLEQYLEEKNLEESFEVSHWNTPKVLIGIGIGAVFSGVTAYIGLKLGLAISAAWYIAYLLGMALKWSPSEVNIATSATTGATHASTGFIFTFPAIFLLASQPAYALADGPLVTLDDGEAFTLAFIGIVASMFAGFLGVMYFIIFRRVWLVEDPLPLPGFEATLKMLDISSDVSTGAVEHARDSLKTIGIWTVLTMVGLFLVEYPLIWLSDRKVALLDYIAQSLHVGDIGLASFYSYGKIHQPSGTENGISLKQTHWSEDTAESLRLHLRRCRPHTVDVCHRVVHEDPRRVSRQPWNHRRLVLPRSTRGVHERPHLRRNPASQHPDPGLRQRWFCIAPDDCLCEDGSHHRHRRHRGWRHVWTCKDVEDLCEHLHGHRCCVQG